MAGTSVSCASWAARQRRSPGDQPVAAWRVIAIGGAVGDDQGLENAVGADRIRQLLQGDGVKVGARLLRVWLDGVDGEQA